MKLGYGKGKYASTTGYKTVMHVEGVDVTTDEGYLICIREHGFRIAQQNPVTGESKELLNKNWEDV